MVTNDNSFKLQFGILSLVRKSMMRVGLTRLEKEKLVLELYSQGKTYHDIAKEARVSLRDIGPILKKSGVEQSLSISSQAYKLFSAGKVSTKWLLL